MKCVIDENIFPPEMRLYSSTGDLKGKKNIDSIQAGVDEIFNSYPNQLESLPLRRMVQKAIDVFEPKQITFEEK